MRNVLPLGTAVAMSKSLHDFRGEHRAAYKRYTRATRDWYRDPTSNERHWAANRAGVALAKAYMRLFRAEQAAAAGTGLFGIVSPAVLLQGTKYPKEAAHV